MPRIHRTCTGVTSLRKNGCKCKKCNGKTFNSLKEWLEYSHRHIYIGRNMTFYVEGAEKSIWCNPYSVKKYGREKALRKYKKYIKGNDELMNNLDSLKGKVLGCWCKEHEDCHADILIKLLKNQ